MKKYFNVVHNGVDKFIVTDTYPYEDNGEKFVEAFGFRLLQNVHLHSLQIVGMKLFLGGREVVDYPNYYEDLGIYYVPSLYNIRKNDGTRLCFECGLDLLEDGRVWVNQEYFNTIGEAFEYCEKKFGDFVVTLEEPMRI